jgi:pimeloyl-ACP methyl ester carboxylesterase
MKLVFQDPTFSLQLLRAIAESYYKCADIGECLSTAHRIREGDFESWHQEWLKTADRVHEYADNSLSEGHNTSAREAYFRASNYYRVAEFLLIDPEDPRIQTTSGNSKVCFSKAAELLSPYIIVDSVEIPYEGTTLPGYYYYVNQEGLAREKKPSPKPLLIAHGGFDSTIEELYSSAAAPALERGYSCLTFEGPGQGVVIRNQKIPFRYDWEKVVSPVVDYVLRVHRDKSEEGYRSTDPQRIALMGISMGGYLAARAAAFEPRLAACILYNGVYDGYGALTSNFPKSLLDAVENREERVVNTIMSILMDLDDNIRFNMKHGMWTMAVNTPFELIEKSKGYTIKDIAHKIQCPTLVLEAEKDDSFPGQPKKVFDALSCSKDFIIFTQEEGAEEHCQCGAFALCNQRIFDWLDKTFFSKNL